MRGKHACRMRGAAPVRYACVGRELARDFMTGSTLHLVKSNNMCLQEFASGHNAAASDDGTSGTQGWCDLLCEMHAQILEPLAVIKDCCPTKNHQPLECSQQIIPPVLWSAANFGSLRHMTGADRRGCQAFPPEAASVQQGAQATIMVATKCSHQSIAARAAFHNRKTSCCAVI